MDPSVEPERAQIWIVREYGPIGDPFPYVHLWAVRPRRYPIAKGCGWSSSSHVHLRGWVCSMSHAQAQREFGVTPDTPLEVITCNRPVAKIEEWGKANGFSIDRD